MSAEAHRRRPSRIPARTRLTWAVGVTCSLVLSLATVPAHAGSAATAAAPRTSSTSVADPAADSVEAASRRATAAPSRSAAAPSKAPASYAGGLRSQTVRFDAVTQSGPTPAQTLTRVVVTRDLTTKKITAKATFAATPSADKDSVVYVFLGSWSGSTCTHRVALAAAAGSPGADGAFFAADGTASAALSATRSRSGTTVSITSTADDRIRSAKWDCGFAFNQSTDAAPTVYTTFDGAKSLTDTFAPKLAVRLSKSMYGNYAGKKTKVRVEIDNVGKGDAKKVRVTASGSGLSVSKAKRSVGTVKKGRSEYLTFTVTLKGSKTRTLSVSAVASGGKKTTTKVKIVQKPKPKKYASLSGRYFWGYMPTTLSDYNGWEPRTVWFLNTRWAYVKAPKDGKKPSCSKATSTCKRYSYNAKTGVAKIGSQKFSVTTEGFTYKARSKDAKKSRFEPITLLAKGTRFSTTLERDDWTGYCMLTCTATSERIAFDKKGRFVWQRSSVGNWSGIGSSWAIVPPDQRGTYKVIGTGRVELRFSDGTTKRYLLGAVRDLRGKTSVKTGIILGETNFY
jgi:hypothetical protein